jgi:outer membrane autotransporter protein
VSAALTGAGALQKTTAGTVTLSGANSYTGGTSITAGTLALSGAGTLGNTNNATTVNGATAILDLGGTSQTQNGGVSLQSGGTIQNGQLTGAISSTGGTVNGIGGTASLTTTAGITTATGTNAYTGATTINGGTLAGGAANAFSAASATTVNTNGTLDLGGFGQTISAVALAGGTIQNGQLTGAISSTGGTVNGIGGTASLTTTAGITTATGTNAYTGATTINGGTLAGGAANAFSAASATTVNTNGTLDLGGFGQTINAVALAGGTIQNGTLSSSGTFDMQSGSVSAVLAGTGALQKTTAGTVTLSGANSYSGATTISAGTLALSGFGSIFSSSSVTVGGGGTFDISNSSAPFVGITTLAGSGSVQLGGNGLFLSNASTEFSGVINGSGTGAGLEVGGGTQTLSGANTYTGPTQIDQGATLALKGAGSIASSSFVGFAALGSGVATFDISQTGSGATVGGLFDPTGIGRVSLGSQTLTITIGSSFNGVIQDGGIGGGSGGSLVIGTNASQNLGGVNTYSGSTTVQSGGTLSLSGNGSIASSSGLALIGTGATFDISASAGNQTIKDLSGVAGSSIQLGANSLAVGTANATSFAGSIAGSGGLIKQGTGTLTLAGTSSYTGATGINAGRLAAGATNAFASASAFTIASGATLDLSGFNQSIGSLAGAGTVGNTGAGTAILTTGGNSASTTFAGVLQDDGPLGLTKIGAGTQTLTGINTYTGPTTVSGGTLAVLGSIASSSGVTVGSGATLAGTGTVPGVTINAGGTFAPGLPPTIGGISVNGSLAMASTAIYLIQVSPTTASKANVSGSASIGGTVDVVTTGGSYKAFTKYTILTTTGGPVTGTFSGANVISGNIGFTPQLSYDANDVYLTLVANSLTPFLPSGLSTNQQSVADAINAFINSGGTLPAGFQNLFNLTSAQLGQALTQLEGQNNAGGAQQAGYQLMNEFLLLMLNPFDSDRAGFGGGGFGAGAGQFAPDEDRDLPPDVAAAYAAVTPYYKAPIAPAPKRWNVWAAAFGGSNNTNGNPNGVGSVNFSAQTGAVAAGVDYKLTQDTLIGVALAGGGTSWGLAQGLGSGHSDAFQAGLYGSQRFGAWYLSGAASFANYWASTTRNLTLPAIDTLNANFNAESWGGRVEGGYRVAWGTVNLTPYAAFQAQSFSTPNYSEASGSGSNQFALAYASRTGNVERAELGSWVNTLYLLQGNSVVSLFGRAAWAHDWQNTPQASATFLGLSPIAAFIVNGAKPAADLGVVTAGAELRTASGWGLMGKFDGEFGSGTQTYAGTARVRYVW